MTRTHSFPSQRARLQNHDTPLLLYPHPNFILAPSGCSKPGRPTWRGKRQLTKDMHDLGASLMRRNTQVATRTHALPPPSPPPADELAGDQSAGTEAGAPGWLAGGRCCREQACWPARRAHPGPARPPPWRGDLLDVKYGHQGAAGVHCLRVAWVRVYTSVCVCVCVCVCLYRSIACSLRALAAQGRRAAVRLAGSRDGHRWRALAGLRACRRSKATRAVALWLPPRIQPGRRGRRGRRSESPRGVEDFGHLTSGRGTFQSWHWSLVLH
jgi:hypothetical protein